MINLFVGVDPGKSGAICSIEAFGRPKVIARANSSYPDIWQSLLDVSSVNQCVACIELVGAMPNQGVVSTFKFGESFGMLQGLLTAAGISFTRVRPSVWCKELGLKKSKEETNTEWKNRHKEMAKQMFPSMDITHATADAFLIAEYCRRKYQFDSDC